MGRSRSNDELAPEIAMELNSSGSPDRIALFGGTYDPVHHGHISIARAAKDALNLDLVIFIPCRQSPHKDDSPIASQAQRLAMLDLALADEPWAESSDIEHLLPEPCVAGSQIVRADKVAQYDPGYIWSIRQLR